MTQHLAQGHFDLVAMARRSNYQPLGWPTNTLSLRHDTQQNSVLLCTKLIGIGVPQGSMLGPALFAFIRIQRYDYNYFIGKSHDV